MRNMTNILFYVFLNIDFLMGEWSLALFHPTTSLYTVNMQLYSPLYSIKAKLDEYFWRDRRDFYTFLSRE